jgi:spore coat polysaccharide biosynthesis protein SpsF
MTPERSYEKIRCGPGGRSGQNDLQPFARQNTFAVRKRLLFLEWIVKRLRLLEEVERVVVATTLSPWDDETERVCWRINCPCFRGNEINVLNRLSGAVLQFPCEIVGRVTADNPLVDISEMDRLIKILRKEKLDYASSHDSGLPVGSGAEVFTAEAFARVARESDTQYEREHVTPRFYRHPESFKQRKIEVEDIHPFAKNVRLTLDTPEDSSFLGALAKGMGFSDPSKQPRTNEILDYLQLHPELVEINKHVEQKTFPKA